MAGLGSADETPGARPSDVRAREIEAPVLVDAEHPLEHLVAGPLEVRVEIAMHANRRRLHERLVSARPARHVRADRPGLVLSERDPRRPLGIELLDQRVVLARLAGGFP